MLKIKKDTSVKLSLALSYLALAVIGAALVILPGMVKSSLAPFGLGGLLAPTLVLFYLASLIVAAADILLIRLLGFVRGGRVFSAGAVMCLRGISWCCFAVCLVLVALSLLYRDTIALIYGAAVVLAAAFLGIVLRVVKNVIEEATLIKSENDFTI